MSELNHALSKIFNEFSNIYKYLGSGERFRAIAYSKVARIIEGMKEDVSVYVKNDQLDEIPGIGESIAKKIMEYLQTGRIFLLEDLKKKLPCDLLELMNVSGFGPASLKHIHDELGLNDKKDLIQALKDGRVSKLKGFGPKKVERMMRGLKLYKQFQERIFLIDAMEMGNGILDELKNMKEIIRIEIAGSLRRRKDTIADIDILATALPKDRKKIIEAFVKIKEVKEVLVKGQEKASILIKEGNRQIDLRIVNESEWGAALIYFTGSKDHTIHLRTIAKEQGFKINEYGVFRNEDHKKIAGETEEDVYAALGYQWIPPEFREDRGEFELSAKKMIPRLIELNEIRGDMQMHSKWSDGSMDIEELCTYIMKNYTYEYIVLTDHSKSERIAGGMNEKEFEAQMEEINKVNDKLGRKFIKAGAEVDILSDGSLDLNDELLSHLDWVCASIHSDFKKDNTERLISACKNEYVCCIGHPSGRLIGKREPYSVSWGKVFEVAAETGTALEINAQPNRMDLNDELSRQALDAGVKLIISTDSHSAYDFSFMQYGVYLARRAGCTKNDILNTSTWEDVEEFIAKKRNHLLVKQ